MLPCRVDLHPRCDIHGKTGSFGQTQMANQGESPHQQQVRQLQRHTISHGGLRDDARRDSSSAAGETSEGEYRKPTLDVD